MSGSQRENSKVHEVSIPPIGLPGTLTVPADPKGFVVFAHGSGSSRHSPRNAFVAETLQQAGLATLLLDLLTEAEGADRRNVFDIPLLAERLNAAVAWSEACDDLEGLNVGLFGASTGAAAALVAAARPGTRIGAVVSRGGRPDLAKPDLARVDAPTLLIVGGADTEVLEMNREAFDQLQGLKELQVIPGATHLFEEPGALEQVARLAAEWFLQNLAPETT